MGFQLSEAVKLDRATIAGMKSTPSSVFLLRAPFTEYEVRPRLAGVVRQIAGSSSRVSR